MGEIRYSQWMLERVAIGDTIRLREGTTTLGRMPDCTIRLSSTWSSRMHCKFYVARDGQIFLEDFSSNGTFVNSRPYRREQVELFEGNRIGIGCEASDEECEAGIYYIYHLRKVPIRRNNDVERNKCLPGNDSSAQQTRVKNESSSPDSSEDEFEKVKMGTKKDNRSEQPSTSGLQKNRDIPSKVDYITVYDSDSDTESGSNDQKFGERVFSKENEKNLENCRQDIKNKLNNNNKTKQGKENNSESVSKPLKQRNSEKGADIVKKKRTEDSESRNKSLDQPSTSGVHTYPKTKNGAEDLHKSALSRRKSEKEVNRPLEEKIKNCNKSEHSQVEDNLSEPLNKKNINSCTKGDQADTKRKKSERESAEKNNASIRRSREHSHEHLAAKKDPVKDGAPSRKSSSNYNEADTKPRHSREKEARDSKGENFHSSSHAVGSNCIDKKLSTKVNNNSNLTLKEINSDMGKKSNLNINTKAYHAKYDVTDTETASSKDTLDLQDEDLAAVDELIAEIKADPGEECSSDDIFVISDDEDEKDNVDFHLSQSLIRDIKQEIIDFELEESFGPPKMKEEFRAKEDKMMSPIEIEDDEDDFDDSVSHWAQKLSQHYFNDSKTKVEYKEKRKTPEIITPPSLPTKKGKLRGVSALSPSKKLKEKLETKTRSVRLKQKIVDREQELKHKWFQKPSLQKRSEREQNKKIREERNQKLKELELEKQANKRKIPDNDDVKIVKKPKVKVTAVNRGAFLSEDLNLKITSPLLSHGPAAKPELMRIPKNISENSSSKGIVYRRKSILETESEENGNNDIIEGRDALVELKIKHRKSRVNSNTSTENGSENSSSKDHIYRRESLADSRFEKNGIKGIIEGRDALAELKIKHRKSRVSLNTSIDDQNNIDEVLKEKGQTKSLLNSSPSTSGERSPPPANSRKKDDCVNNPERNSLQLKSILRLPTIIQKVKKRVTFNDTPKIKYIEVENNSGRRVDTKDASIDLSDFVPKKRKEKPIRVDHTDMVLSEILSWNPTWLERRMQEVNGRGHDLVPLLHTFASFDEFVRILFPLMKLEFWASIEQDFCHKSPAQYVSLRVENFKAEKRGIYDRFVYYCDYVPSTLKTDCPFNPGDLCILKIEVSYKKVQVFAFIESLSKINSTHKVHYQITLQSNINVHCKELIDLQKTVKVKSISQIRVDIGAFNAVYHLKQSPLLKVVLDPHTLANMPVPPVENLKYKGCDKLNKIQEETLLKTYLKSINTSSISLIEGPPGTGKSRLITNLAMQLLYGTEVKPIEKKILLCSQSNTAIDVIVLKLLKIRSKMKSDKFKLVRFGILERMHPHVRCVSVQVQIDKHLRCTQQHSVYEESLKNEKLLLEAKLTALNSINANGSNNVHHDDLQKVKHRLDMVNRLLNKQTSLEVEKNLYPKHIQGAHIVCTTLSSCIKLLQYTNDFDICIIDEATQCLEPWTLIPLQFGISSIVLVGDSQQLPATVLSKITATCGLGQSLFTRIQKCLELEKNNPILSLRIQYRMHPEICKWPNSYFYKNQLINDASTSDFKILIKPYTVFNLEFSQDITKNENGQISNSEEAKFVVDLIAHLISIMPPNTYTYGVITPYAQHRDNLNTKLSAAGIKDISVNTIDSYQGKEKDVIIISNARTRGVGFLSNCQRLNVAMTRASKCLVLCGNFLNVQRIPVWKSLLEDAKQRGFYYHIRKSDPLDFEKKVMCHLKVS